MTGTSGPPAVPVRLDFDSNAATFSKAMDHLDHAATKELDRAGIDRRLRELIRIRASQLNGCAYCVDMHTKDARASETHVPAAAYAAVAEQYSPDEIAALLCLIVTINAWNTIGVTTRAWTPGSYQP